MTTPPPGSSPDPSAYPPPGNPPQGYYPPPQPAGYPNYPGQQGYPDPSGYLDTGDPLTATDFGGWFQRVFGVVKRSFAQLAIISLLPAVVAGVYYAVITLSMPSQADLAAQLQANPELAQNPSAAGSVAMMAVLGRLVPIMLVFSILILVANALAQGAAFYVAIRDANGQPSTAQEGLRFAAGRLLPLIGWVLLAGILVLLGTLVFILPGIYLAVVLFSSLFGVVVVERNGIGRCFQLIKGRFWAMTGRWAVAILLVMVASIILSIVAGVAGLISPIAAAVVYAIVMVPIYLFFAAVYVVSYAELRHHENPGVTTASLVAEMTRG
jgi:hypothetical protein